MLAQLNSEGFVGWLPGVAGWCQNYDLCSPTCQVKSNIGWPLYLGSRGPTVSVGPFLFWVSKEHSSNICLAS